MINNPYQPPMMNYTGYNPYPYNMRFPEQQPIQQPVQQLQQSNLPVQTGVNGRIVTAVEQITANDVPMDGSMAFFPKQDLSEIYVKGWSADGTIKTVVYRPYTDTNNNKLNNLSSTDKKTKFDLSDESTEVFMKKFDELFGKIEQLEDRFDKNLASQRKSSRTQSKGSETE